MFPKYEDTIVNTLEQNSGKQNIKNVGFEAIQMH